MLLVGSVQFIGAMIVEQLLRPGYSDWGNTISDLGVATPAGWGYSWIFNSSVVLLGVLGSLGILGLVPTLPRRRTAYAGEVLLLVGTAGAIAVGLFPETSTALWGHAHDAASIITFFDANVGMLVLGIALRGDRIWGEWCTMTTFLGLFSTVALAFYVQSYETNGAFLGLGEGGLERVVTFPVLFWAIGVGVFTNRREASLPSVGPGAPGAATAS